MVEFGSFRPERPYQDLVTRKLRPGDISTHMYLGAVPMVDDQGKVMPYLFEARKRGVIFDAGHGGGSFLWRQAVKDMLNVMSKFLIMGMSLDEVVLRSTWHPAREIKREELGNLPVGAPADVADRDIGYDR